MKKKVFMQVKNLRKAELYEKMCYDSENGKLPKQI